MSKTIEFIEKEIKNTKELLGLDDALCLKTDDDYKFWYNRLKMFQQIKAELEAWEIVKEKQVDIFYINVCKNAESYNKYKTSIRRLTNDELDKIKKALEIEEGN